MVARAKKKAKMGTREPRVTRGRERCCCLNTVVRIEPLLVSDLNEMRKGAMHIHKGGASPAKKTP